MIVPNLLHFGQTDHMLLTTGTAKRLLTACVLGGLIGLEREWRHKASGIRVNMLICLGCSFFTLLSTVLAGEGTADKGRIAANIVQGIGFLGAGLILHTRSRVVGLTSAATVFVVASIGMACGAGLYAEAILSTAIVLVALTIVRVFEVGLAWKRYPLYYEVRGHDQGAIYQAILPVLDRAGMRLNVLERDSVGNLERVTFLVITGRKSHDTLLTQLRACEGTDQVLSFRDPDEE